MAKKIDLATAPTRFGSRYPSPFDAPCLERKRWRLGDAAGLTQFGVNLLRLAPGVWSAQRHWHASEDEFVYVVEGEVVLITDAGEETFHAGDSAGFKAGDPDAHHFLNRSESEVVLLEIGTRSPVLDEANYPDIDLQMRDGRFEHREGTPYEAKPKG
jgi:uncharacterized cupin superfamily protein